MTENGLFFMKFEKYNKSKVISMRNDVVKDFICLASVDKKSVSYGLL